MGYLFCENCGGYYELEKDENPEDFQSCHCNGELTYYESINHKLGKEKPFIQDKTVIQKEKYHSQLMAIKYRNLEIAGLFILILSFVFIFLNQIIIGIITFLFSFYIFGEVFYKSYSWQKGADGEIQVAKFLTKMPEGYFVFNDVKIPTYQGNIDHVVIGPTGIFVIETKNYDGLLF